MLYCFLIFSYERPTRSCVLAQDIRLLSPHVREFETVLSVELGFRIPMVSEIPDSLSCFLDSKAQDSGFHKQNLIPGFRFPQAKPSRILDYTSKDLPDSGIRIPLHEASFSHRCIFILYHSLFVDHWRIEDVTCPLVDTNFIFECSTRYRAHSWDIELNTRRYNSYAQADM